MYDLLIKNAHLVTGEIVEIGVTAGKISEIGKDLSSTAKEILELASDTYLSPGWIDSHVHCYEKMALYYDYPDEIGIKKGVTTIVDAGSTGAENIGDFYQHAHVAKTNVLALINISKTGIVAQDELAQMANLDDNLTKAAIEKYPEFIIGLKARMSSSVVGGNGIKPLEKAKDLQKELKLPLMVHIGSAPPKLEEILIRLDEGDIVTHCFNGKENGILASDDSIKEFVWEAYRKGVIFDIGHGSDSFNFHVAEIAHEKAMYATTISSDIYHRNRQDGPVYDLATTLEKLWQVGYDLADLIKKVTSQPAKVLHLANKGELEVGYDADFTIFKIGSGEKTLVDSNADTRKITKQLIPQQTIVGGKIYDLN